MSRAGHQARLVNRVVVVGASLAGLRAAEGLRAEGFDGELVVVGDEVHAPYNRPPLSKELLAGDVERDEIELQAVGDLRAEWRLGVAATGLDLAARRVALDDGSEPPTTASSSRRGRPRGRSPRPAGSGADLEGVFLLRTVDDSLRLRAALDDASTLVVVGAGFIGCEVAATARKLGLEVTMVDVAPAPKQPRGGRRRRLGRGPARRPRRATGPRHGRRRARGRRPPDRRAPRRRHPHRGRRRRRRARQRAEHRLAGGLRASRPATASSA